MSEFTASFPFKALFPKCSEEELQKVSKELARPLPFPDDYLVFLREWNGTLFSYEFEICCRPQNARDADDFCKVRSLYGISPDADRADLRVAGSALHFERRVSSHILAIGEDESWNRVCMSLDGKTYGHIYLWQPGEPWERGEEVPTEQYLDLVAGSFTEFWNGLLTEEEYRKRYGDDDDLEWERHYGRRK